MSHYFSVYKGKMRREVESEVVDGGEADRLDSVLEAAGRVLDQIELLLSFSSRVVKGHVGSVLEKLDFVRGGVIVLSANYESLQLDIT